MGNEGGVCVCDCVCDCCDGVGGGECENVGLNFNAWVGFLVGSGRTGLLGKRVPSIDD